MYLNEIDSFGGKISSLVFAKQILMGHFFWGGGGGGGGGIWRRCQLVAQTLSAIIIFLTDRIPVLMW